jgi:putative ABC transport system permease protein
MLQDLRFGLRMLGKHPGFTALAVLTLALGIGSTAAVFSLIEGVLLTPPPYKDPQQLALIQSVRTDGQSAAGVRRWPAQQWMEWQKEARSFDGIAAYGWTFNFLVSEEGSESLEGMAVTRDYFRVLGVQPVLGRTFLDSETGLPTAPPVIVIGYDLWQRKYNGDPDIVGKPLRMSRRDVPPTIVGVMPPGIRFLPSPSTAQEPNYNVNGHVDFWIPATPNPERLKQSTWDLVARVRSGAPLDQAQTELRLLAARQAEADGDFGGITPRLQPLRVEMNGDGRRFLLPLLGASAIVLLIACGNVAALLLVRGLQRQPEYGVRTALGVGRLALFRQAAAESLLLAFGGGALGAALAFAIVTVFKSIGGHAIPRLDAVSTGWPVLAFGFGGAIVAAVLAGLVPAVRASRLDPMAILKSAGPKTSAGRVERRLLAGVTIAQTALTLALLVGAGLLIRTMMNVSRVVSGYTVDHLLSMTVTAVQGDWMSFHTRALERVSALPGVEGAAFAWGVPLTGNNWPGSVELEGQEPAARAADRLAMPLRSITPGYFSLLGLNLSDGRDFRNTDVREAPPVVIVNQALADKYFKDTTAVGKKIWLNSRNNPASEIVGVVQNGRTNDLTRAAEPEIYAVLWQRSAFSKDLIVRTSGDPRSIAAAVQRELRGVDPTAATENVKTMEQIRDDSLAARTFAMQLLVGFAVIGTLLTVVGIYGVLSLSVASRRREIAIRSAVGAQRGDIRALILSDGLRLIGGGVVIGIVAAFVLSRALTAFLFEVEPTDPVMLGSAGVLFAAIGLLACWMPTRRATEVDPLDALRCD